MLTEYVRYAADESVLAFCLTQHLQILPLTKQLTAVCGNLWAHSLQSRR